MFCTRLGKFVLEAHAFKNVHLLLQCKACFNNSDGRVVRVSASGAADMGLIPSGIKSMTLQLVYIASLLDAKH